MKNKDINYNREYYLPILVNITQEITKGIVLSLLFQLTDEGKNTIQYKQTALIKLVGLKVDESSKGIFKRALNQLQKDCFITKKKVYHGGYTTTEISITSFTIDKVNEDKARQFLKNAKTQKEIDKAIDFAKNWLIDDEIHNILSENKYAKKIIKEKS
jgi:hypothetical protein